MARRMFSQQIVSSDKFLDMPTSSRELYFQLGMYADDDGFVSPKKVLRITGASDDDFRLLKAKEFVIPFESGVIVIKHWRVNNLVRKDWYHETTFQSEKALIFKDKSNVYDLLTNRQQNVTVMNEGVNKLKIEDSIKEIRDNMTRFF